MNRYGVNVETINPLAGEGEVRVVVRTRVRRECEVCGDPATKRIAFCYFNGRRNPASSMYGRDDCSYCSDAETFACDACASTTKRDACPDGMSWASTFTLRDHNEHMFLAWRERVATPDELATLASAQGGDA